MKKITIFILVILTTNLFPQHGITWMDMSTDKKSRTYITSIDCYDGIFEDTRGDLTIFCRYWQGAPLLGIKYNTADRTYSKTEIIDKKDKELSKYSIMNDCIVLDNYTYFLIANPISGSQKNSMILKVDNSSLEIVQKSLPQAGDKKLETSFGRLLLIDKFSETIFTVEICSEDNVNGFKSLKKFQIKISQFDQDLNLLKSNVFFVDEAIRATRLTRIKNDILIEFMMVGKTFEDKYSKTYLYTDNNNEFNIFEPDNHGTDFDIRSPSTFISLSSGEKLQCYFYQNTTEKINGFFIAKYVDDFTEPEFHQFIPTESIFNDNDITDLKTILVDVHFVFDQDNSDFIYLSPVYNQLKDKKQDQKSQIIKISTKTGEISNSISEIPGHVKHIWIHNNTEYFIKETSGENGWMIENNIPVLMDGEQQNYQANYFVEHLNNYYAFVQDYDNTYKIAFVKK